MFTKVGLLVFFSVQHTTTAPYHRILLVLNLSADILGIPAQCMPRNKLVCPIPSPPYQPANIDAAYKARLACHMSLSLLLAAALL